jgi:hypothetical protein
MPGVLITLNVAAMQCASFLHGTVVIGTYNLAWSDFIYSFHPFHGLPRSRSNYVKLIKGGLPLILAHSEASMFLLFTLVFDNISRI